MAAERDVEVTYEVSAFVAELRRLADALEQGATYSIHVDGEDVTIPADAIAAIAHEREDGQVELEFQLSWAEDTDEVDADHAGETAQTADHAEAGAEAH